ncbi:MAG TPA: AarF/UbiB family protein [Vicinamibacterales bacterium]|nr:AarF/UbiB family protein [Vicinamibacterales bacterium]
MGVQAIPRLSSDPKARRRTVEAQIAEIGQLPAVRRAPPPEGRLGADDYPMPRVRAVLVDLGPVFASFGRYLSSRIDLVARRDSLVLASIPDRGTALTPSVVETWMALQLGAPVERRFFAFNRDAHDVTLWSERHHAWIAPGVPVVVLVVRPDAESWLESDVPLLRLIQPWFDIEPAAFAAAVEDFTSTLRRRLDQTRQAAAFATLAADASASPRGFGAPVCYRDHSAAGALTLERPAGVTLGDLMIDDTELMMAPDAGRSYAARLASAWLHQALAGRTVPFDFGPRDIVVDAERLVLVGGAFEPQTSAARVRFLGYLNAVAADDPDAAAAWILDAAAPVNPDRREEMLRRRLRQAVPFRDGEWSGDDRLAEHLLVQWRMAREAGWPLATHHLHLYRGLQIMASLATQLAPLEDPLLAALQDERLEMGLAQVRRMGDPGTVVSALDRLLQEMVQLPQRVDDVLTLAAEGRLRVKLHVPESNGSQQTHNRTVLLVALLVALTGVASIVRQFAPTFGPGAERLGAVALLFLGGWLLVAAARM